MVPISEHASRVFTRREPRREHTMGPGTQWRTLPEVSLDHGRKVRARQAGAVGMEGLRCGSTLDG